MRKAIATLVVAVVISGCTAEETAPSPGEASGSPSASGAVDASIPGRILLGRSMPSGTTRFIVVDADGSDQMPFAPGKEFETRNVSPDGARLAVVAASDEGVLVGGTIGVDGRGLRLFEAQDQTLNLACGVWAPHERMACEGWDDTDASRSGIYTVRASDGGHPERLTRRRDIPCDYSPDGTQLAFVRAEADGASGTLMVMDADGDGALPLLSGVTLAGIACDWSPDGRSIITGSDGTLMVVTPDGVVSPFAGDGIDGYASGAVWSLDGSRVLFSMTLEGEQFDVYTAAADASDLRRITDSPLLEEAMTWLP